jgi:hypothetical protein
MTIGKRAVIRGFMLVLTAGLSGCLVAAAGGAGGAIALSGHTAEAIVERPVADMASVAEQVMEAEGISITDSSSEDSGGKRSFEGKKDDLDVTVTIERTDAGTKLGVVARRSAVSWDDDYARALLAKIIA